MKKILKPVGVFILTAVFITALWVTVAMHSEAKTGYYTAVPAKENLEEKYTNMGTYKVSYVEHEAEGDLKKYEIWYPSEMEKSDKKFPLVVMTNGSYVPATQYYALFEHLASWGFVVIGNEELHSADGEASDLSLLYMLTENENEESIFYKKIDTENIGIGGHSQGGIGALNAVTNFERGAYYKAVFTASMPQKNLAQSFDWYYDLGKINIPYFMTAGTEKIDAEIIAPEISLEKNYSEVSEKVEKIMAIRAGAEHGSMLVSADGYMTAWFLYYLKADEEAGQVFRGENAEILFNDNWQGIYKNI